ncbi:Transcription factor bHLH123 [Vitis vinifera]|uniref:Transcription factor bHLH123 n=1 Tax=Vitis vinifera TaxID=29760 RepID=A0A438HPM8_VITVI|nr:Transcription factor bHLH123 [Vitis vinifera]
MVDIKARSCEESASVSDSSLVFQDIQKPQQPDSASGGGSMLMESTLQMMGFGLSSSSTTTDWNPALIRGSGRAESNYHSMLQDDMSSRLNGMDSPQIQKDWSPKNFSTGGEDSSICALKPMNQGFALDQQRLNSINSSGDSTVTCQGFSSGFPMGSASYGYPSTLLQGLYDPDPQPQQYLFDNRSMNYSSMANYRTSMNELSPSWPKYSPYMKPSLPKQQPNSHLHFTNNTPFWNASAAALNDIRASFFPSPQSQFLTPTFEEKPNCSKLTTKLCYQVRKEKLGDRITALQQLVSPFGKTDTASVLHEAIEYIKFLHDQVSVLSTPYMKNGAPIQPQQTSEKLKDTEGSKQDLRSRGLCLVPISSTFPVANETTADYWTPTFGGTFR